MSSIKTILYTQKKLADGQSPVMLYVYEEKPYRLSLGYRAFPKDWDNKKGRFNKSHPNAKAKNLELRKKELLAHELVDDFVRKGERFDFPTFKKVFRGEKEEKQEEKKEVNFYDFVEELISAKKKLGKISTSRGYKDVYNILKRYHPKPLKFEDINYSFLKKIEAELFAIGSKKGTVFTRMAILRAMYYEGIRCNHISKDKNPFNNSFKKDGYNFSKFKSDLRPRALDKEELDRFRNFDIKKYPELSLAWYYFMFSFKLFGINFTDIAKLTDDNIKGTRLEYVRQKTGKSFSLLLTKETQDIIKNFSSESDYLFPVLKKEKHNTIVKIKNKIGNTQKQINDDLRQIALIQGISKYITFYTARHTAAMALKRKGISTDIISEALGHSDLAVTQHYLSKFDNNVLDSAIMDL